MREGYILGKNKRCARVWTQTHTHTHTPTHTDFIQLCPWSNTVQLIEGGLPKEVRLNY